MVLAIQIFGFLFALFMIYYTFLNYKRKEFTGKEFGFWLILWVVFLIITFFPSVLEPIVKVGGFYRPLDFLIISGFIFLIVAIFYTYTITRKTQHKLEQIVRALAIEKEKKK